MLISFSVQLSPSGFEILSVYGRTFACIAHQTPMTPKFVFQGGRHPSRAGNIALIGRTNEKEWVVNALCILLSIYWHLWCDRARARARARTHQNNDSSFFALIYFWFYSMFPGQPSAFVSLTTRKIRSFFFTRTIRSFRRQGVEWKTFITCISIWISLGKCGRQFLFTTVQSLRAFSSQIIIKLLLFSIINYNVPVVLRRWNSERCKRWPRMGSSHKKLNIAFRAPVCTPTIGWERENRIAACFADARSPRNLKIIKSTIINMHLKIDYGVLVSALIAPADNGTINVIRNV